MQTETRIPQQHPKPPRCANPQQRTPVMSKITVCKRCGGNIVEPAYDGDGACPVPPVCRCAGQGKAVA
jgi:hypothetical protein